MSILGRITTLVGICVGFGTAALFPIATTMFIYCILLGTALVLVGVLFVVFGLGMKPTTQNSIRRADRDSEWDFQP